MLKAYDEYCCIWKLEVNIAKTKVLIFSKAKIPNYEFKYKDEILEVVSEFRYLGILFSKNNSFFKTKKQIADQSTKQFTVYLKRLVTCSSQLIYRLNYLISLLNLFYCMGVKFGGSGILKSFKVCS